MTVFEKRLLDAAAQPYKQAGKFAWHFARGKLSGDPVFTEIFRLGLIAPAAHVVDIGCGQGLLSAWLMAAQTLGRSAQWPADWAAAPLGVSVQGIELMRADVLRAQQALAANSDRYAFEVGDMCTTAFDKAQVVVILDVLHYVPYAAQDEVLARVRNALAPKGLLILRIGNADGGLGFTVSNWVDRLIFFARGHSTSKLYCRTEIDWTAALKKLGFQVEAKPMSQGTPFSNVLLLARLSP
jgi:2-polyprenyl-3-methyl-5-hydroxy-6-metoxy-1,4-benzoquinol methylase